MKFGREFWWGGKGENLGKLTIKSAKGLKANIV